jgi:hypothetical protein
MRLSSTMKARLLHLLPNVRWVPHDIPQSDQSKKEKSLPRRLLLPKRSESSHGKMRSTLSMSSELDEEIFARTHVQTQSMFFSMLPIEIRKMVYEMVIGSETIHLTMGTKRRLGHFVCPAERNGEKRACTCKVLVGGAGNSEHLNVGCARMLRVCRRMYVSHCCPCTKCANSDSI